MMNLLEKANVEVKKVVDYIKENEDMFSYMDFKLHDVSWYCYKDLENDYPLCYESYKSGSDFFSWFCNDSYMIFEEWCKNERIDFNKMQRQLGRTSKFYLHNYDTTNIDFMLFDIMYDISTYWYADYIDFNNGVLSAELEEYEEEATEVLEYIAEDFYNDFIYRIADMKKVYEYIKDFKNNQVEYFKEFLEYYEADYQYEAKVEADKQAADKQTALEIVDRYKISNNDLETLKKTIYTI